MNRQRLQYLRAKHTLRTPNSLVEIKIEGLPLYADGKTWVELDPTSSPEQLHTGTDLSTENNGAKDTEDRNSDPDESAHPSEPRQAEP